MRNFDGFQLGVLLAGGFGASLLLAVRIAYRNRRRPADELSWVLRFVGWLLLLPCVLGPPAALVLGLLQLFNPRSVRGSGVTIALVALAVIVVPGLAYAVGIWVRFRDSSRRALLWALAIADQRQIPMAEAARAMAWERADRFSAYCENVADRLERGVRLDDALAIREVDASLAVKLGLFHNSIGRCLRTWLSLRETAPAGVQRYNYLLMVASVLAALTPFFLFYVTNVMVALQGGFRNSVGGASGALDSVALWVQNNAWLVSPLLLLPPLLLLLSSAHQLGWLGRDVPLLGRLAMPLDGARVLRALAQSADINAPLERTLGMLAREYPKRRVRLRLTIAAQQLAGGRRWTEALRDVELLTASEADVLEAAEAAGNLDWALAELAARKTRRLESRWMAIDIVVFPLVTLLIGALVALLAAGVLQNLTSLIEATL